MSRNEIGLNELLDPAEGPTAHPHLVCVCNVRRKWCASGKEQIGGLDKTLVRVESCLSFELAHGLGSRWLYDEASLSFTAKAKRFIEPMRFCAL